MFKQFQALVERRIDKKLKCIQTDNRRKYKGLFDEYCRQQNIRHQKTTPQLNELAERMNKTLIKRERYLLSQAQLRGSFLGKALSTIIYALNLTLSVSLQFDVPDKVQTGKDVTYDHMHVFGCKSFVYILKDEMYKLDVKTKQFIFLGYGQDEFSYKLYDPADKKLVKS